MEYQNRDDLYYFFKKTIDEEVEKIVEKLQKDINDLKGKAQVLINKELSEEQESLVENEKQTLGREYNLKISALQYQKRLSLMRKKQKLLEQLFLKLEEEITKFVQSERYRPWLLNKLSLYDLSDCSSLLVSPEDTVIHSELKGVNIELSPGLIGGFIIKSKDQRTMIDESLKKKIKEAQSWFYDHAEWPSE